MTQSKHTSGPWIVEQTKQMKKQDENIVIYGPRKEVICHLLCPDLRPYNYDNAHLIAAAPDLLKTLKEILYLDAVKQADPKRLSVDEDLNLAKKKAREAIAKANGGAQ